MDDNQYPRIRLFSWRILLWMICFFVLTNVVIWFLFRDVERGIYRLRGPASYGQIIETVRTIEQDPRPKVVFLGASSMWGAPGLADPRQTVPWQFSSFLKEGVVVYNLSYPSARPLDVLLLAMLVEEYADFIVADVNTAFLGSEYNQGIRTDRTKYIRTQALLQAHQGELFQKSEDAYRCLEKFGVIPHREIVFNVRAWLPVVRHKDDINHALFNKPFFLFSSEVMTAMFELLRFQKNGMITLKNAFSHHDELPAPPEMQVPFDGPVLPLTESINSCVTQALVTFSQKHGNRIMFYVSPHSQFLTSELRQEPTYNKNAQFVASLYEGVSFVDFDQELLIPSREFIDETHFSAAGHRRVAEQLYEHLRKNEVSAKLLK